MTEGNLDKVENSASDAEWSGLTREEAERVERSDQDFEKAKEKHAECNYLREKRRRYLRSEFQSRSRRLNRVEPVRSLNQPVVVELKLGTPNPLSWRRSPEARAAARAVEKAKENCPLSDEDLINLFRTTGGIDGFAEQLTVERRRALRWLKKAGVDVFEEIAREWEDGSSLRKLSAKHGPLPKTISNWIKSTGRVVRPRNSNPKYDITKIYSYKKMRWSTNRIALDMGLSWATVQRVIDNNVVN